MKETKIAKMYNDCADVWIYASYNNETKEMNYTMENKDNEDELKIIFAESGLELLKISLYEKKFESINDAVIFVENDWKHFEKQILA